MRRSSLLFLYSTPNIVGSILGLLGLGCYFAGIIESYWYVIVPGLYLVGLLVIPKGPTLELGLNHQLTASELRTSLGQLLKTIRGRVAPDVLTKVKNITQSIEEVLPRVGDMNSGEYNVHIIRQTALEYLPDALQNYLNLPLAFARFHPVKDGKTAKQLLMQQLDLLETQMRQIAVDIHRSDTEQLLVHGRFLEEKFRRSEWWLEGDRAA